MAFDQALANRIPGALARKKGITEKKMFGGIVFFLNGNTLDAAVSIHEGKSKVRLRKDGKGTLPWTRKAPSGRTSASGEATASLPRSYRSRTGTSRLRCPRHFLRATRSRSP
jgi:hypothetical protein